MNAKTTILFRLPEPRLQGLRAANRQLRRRLGASAPSPEELLVFQLSRRSPRLIASEYAEFRARCAA